MMEEKVRVIIAELMGYNVGDVQLHTSFSDLCMDSLHVVEMAIALEKEFDCIIKDSRIEEFKTVDDVCSELNKIIK